MKKKDNKDIIMKLFEIRFHGRGGQGAVTGAKILGDATRLENKYFQ